MIGTSLSDRYQLTGVLGRGGMGVVYRAEDPFLHREVAVKVLMSGVLTAQAEERFKREARLVAQMDHPAIVAIYDIGRHGDSLFYVMPVVQGSTVKSLVKEGTLDLGGILEVVAQVAEALDYAHQRGVVHRDVKPENIMVSLEDSRPRSRVMDFGLAIGTTASRLTQSGGLPGTLAYLSPEQILSKEIDGRSDLYSLGTVLYECVVGETPFSGSRYTMLYRIAHDAPPRPGRRGVASELERVILSCLAKEPEKRPSRGNDLAAELRRIAAGLGDEERFSGAAAAVRLRERKAVRDPVVLPVVGRRRELEVLSERLEKALAGECQLALLGGEAGMGKTRLLREVEELARSQGVRVLQGRFSEQETAFPFQGFGELIQDYFRTRDPLLGSGSGGEEGSPAADLRDLLGDLQVLFPVLTEISLLRSESDVRPLELRAESLRSRDRTHVFELLARTLGRLAGGEPVALLLENLHGAGDSIDALQYVVRRLGPTPTLVVGTYRPSEAPRRHPLRRLLQSMADDSSFSSIVLEPLTPIEHQQLATAFLESRRLLKDGQTLGSELLGKLYRATEGNPFFTQELLQSLADSGGMVPDPSTGVWSFSGQGSLLVDALPETIQQAVESRLDRLPETELAILSTASVLGRSFDYQDLEALLEGTGIDEAVDGLIREGILDEDRQARGDLLHFSSGVVRDVLYGKLSRRRRRLYHRRHAEQLEARFAGRTERVYPQLVEHWSAADVPRKTVEYALLLARSSLDTFGAEAAVRSSRLALELVEEEEVDRTAEGELRYLLANALRVSGAIESAFKEAARAAQALNANGDPGSAAAAALVAAEISWQVRKTGDTTRWVEKGIELARAALGETASGREIPVALGEAELAGVRQTLRQLLLLCATTANLRGEQLRARACQEEADELLQAETAGETEPPSGGTLVTTLLQPLTTLDPSRFETVEDCEVLGNVFETLLRFDAEGNLVPGLADTWETSEDGLTVEVVLDRDAWFSNGRPLRAADVKTSLERSALAEDQASALAVLHGIEPFRHGEAPEIRGIETLGEHVLRFRLKEPLAIFPALLTDLRTSIRLIEDLGLVGTGPFRIGKHDRERVVLEKNPNYWGGPPAVLDRIDFRMSLDASGIAAGLRMGEIDVGCDLLPDDIDHLLRDSRFRTGLVESTQKNTYFVYWNARGPLAQSAAVRRALSGVIRTRDLVWRTMGRLAQPATCIIPPGILGHDPGRRPLSLSREQASSLLRSTGLPTPMRLVAAIHPLFFDRYSSLLMALIDEWASIGAEVAIETTSMEDYLLRWQDNEEIDLLIGRWVPDFDDPDSVIYTLYHSRHGHLGRGLESAAADLLMEKARHENRAGVRQSLYRKVEALLAEQCAVLPLFHGIDYRMVSPEVRGLRFLGRPPYLSYSKIGKLPRQSERVTVGSAEVVPIRVGLPSRLDTLDPAAAVFAEQAEVTPVLFETLTQVGESARIVPGLAAEFRSENGARRYHFRLRKDVRFHDGRKLTARDVRHTFERLARRQEPRPDPAVLAIRGVEAFRDGAAAEIDGLLLPSAHEVTIELREPLTFYPAMLSRQVLGIVPEGTDSVAGRSWRDGCVGTGPFRLVSFLPGERIELESNPHYWRPGSPRSSHLVFELGLESEKAVEEFRSGRLALLSHLRPRDAEKLRRETRHAAHYLESPGLSTYFLALNSRQGLFADPDLRRSFVDAFDLEGMIRATLGRTAVPARGLIPPGLLGYEAVSEGGPVRYPRSAASLRGLKLRLAAHPVFEGVQSAFWRLFLRNASALGLEARVRFLTQEELLGVIEPEDADAFAARWFAGYPDPGSFYSLFMTDGGVCGRLCGSEEVDRLIRKGSAQSDPGLRHTIYRELEQTMAREALVKPFFHEQVYRFYRPEVTDVRIRFGHPEVAYEELRLSEG